MTKQGWIAIMLAITLPSTALIVVLLTRNGGTHRHHRERRHRTFRHDRARPGAREGRHHGFGRDNGFSPKMKFFGGDRHARFGAGHGWQRGGKARHGAPLWKGLGLSEDQRTKMKALRKEARTKKEALFLKADSLEKELSALLEKETPEKSAIEAKLAEISSLRLKARTIRVLNRVEMQKLLTAEQKKLFAQRLNEGPKGHEGRFRRGRRFGRRGHHGMGRWGNRGTGHHRGFGGYRRHNHHRDQQRPPLAPPTGISPAPPAMTPSAAPAK